MAEGVAAIRIPVLPIIEGAKIPPPLLPFGFDLQRTLVEDNRIVCPVRLPGFLRPVREAIESSATGGRTLQRCRRVVSILGR